MGGVATGTSLSQDSLGTTSRTHRMQGSRRREGRLVEPDLVLPPVVRPWTGQGIAVGGCDHYFIVALLGKASDPRRVRVARICQPKIFPDRLDAEELDNRGRGTVREG